MMLILAWQMALNKKPRRGGADTLSKDAYLLAISSETVRRLRPLALRLANTLRPLAVDILSLKPCLLRRFLFEGWYVLFIAILFYRAGNFGLQR
jgi:hypothetical protein